MTDPTTWTTFDKAMAAHRNRKDIAGVGFVFVDDDAYSGVDLDRCRNPVSGVLEPWAEGVVREVRSYTEISPSQAGVKVIVRGKLPLGSKTRKGHIAMYSHVLYFTMTGHHLAGTPPTVEDRQEALLGLYSRVFGDVGAESDPHDEVPVSGLPDDEIMSRATGSRNGEKFARLWAGDTTGYRSDSEADLALCGMLVFWLGPDAERIERLFARSGLSSRAKWADREDYR